MESIGVAHKRYVGRHKKYVEKDKKYVGSTYEIIKRGINAKWGGACKSIWEANKCK